MVFFLNTELTKCFGDLGGFSPDDKNLWRIRCYFLFGQKLLPSRINNEDLPFVRDQIKLMGLRFS